MQGWDEVERWRREQRLGLLARRQAIAQNERRRLQLLITRLLEERFPQLAHALIGIYWPFRGEIGFHGLVRRLLTQGARAALPVVVEKGRPLEFCVVRPTVLLVPLVGFDGHHYRLGYGGGYYDRALAAMSPKPLTIGVGCELGRLATIHPQAHDPHGRDRDGGGRHDHVAQAIGSIPEVTP